MDVGELHPVAMIEADAVYLPAEEEGETGFELRRLYLGARWSPVPWATAMGSIQALGDHGPTIVDAFVRVEPHALVDVSLGYAKTPLFASARDQSIETGPIPELSLSTGAFWPGRNAGVEVHFGEASVPVEAWVRVGNGSHSPAGNDNPQLSFDGRADLVLGRALGEREDTLGLRVGGGFHLEDAEDRPGITAHTPTGFEFWRSPTISGRVWTAEGHLVGLGGPVQLLGNSAASGRKIGNPARRNWQGVVDRLRTLLVAPSDELRARVQHISVFGGREASG